MPRPVPRLCPLHLGCRMLCPELRKTVWCRGLELGSSSRMIDPPGILPPQEAGRCSHVFIHQMLIKHLSAKSWGHRGIRCSLYACGGGKKINKDGASPTIEEGVGLGDREGEMERGRFSRWGTKCLQALLEAPLSTACWCVSSPWMEAFLTVPGAGSIWARWRWPSAFPAFRFYFLPTPLSFCSQSYQILLRAATHGPSFMESNWSEKYSH